MAMGPQPSRWERPRVQGKHQGLAHTFTRQVGEVRMERPTGAPAGGGGGSMKQGVRLARAGEGWSVLGSGPHQVACPHVGQVSPRVRTLSLSSALA